MSPLAFYGQRFTLLTPIPLHIVLVRVFVHTADLGSVFASIVKVIVMSVGIESVYAFPSAHFASSCPLRGCVIIIIIFSLRGKAFSFAAHSHRLDEGNDD